MISYYGGIDRLINKFNHMIRGSRSAQLCIAALVSIVDCATANNTVAIIITGGVAKNIADESCGFPHFCILAGYLFLCISGNYSLRRPAPYRLSPGIPEWSYA